MGGEGRGGMWEGREEVGCGTGENRWEGRGGMWDLAGKEGSGQFTTVNTQ